MKEVDNMEKSNVWTIIDKNDIPEFKKTIGLTWVFKINSNGSFKERLVELGFYKEQE